jgi:hypothetical protein
MRIDSVFDADSEYGIGFDIGCSFLDENGSIIGKKAQKWYSQYNVTRY